MQKNIVESELEIPLLDLHGELVHTAWGRFKTFANECHQESHKKARVITGKGKILREFTSEFDSKTGGYKLIERDRNGKIINQEIVLSNNN